MKKRFLSYSIALVLVGWGFVDAKAQQPLKVGSNPTNINRTAVLDVEATNKGALLPRVALTSLTDVTTIANPANALTVFNTATDGTAPDNVTPGYYYYSTAINKWVRLLSQGDAISTTSQNIYNTDGTLTGNRTINVGSNSLNFLSNASGNNVLWNLGRTATEMDMGVAGSSDAGLAGTVAGDGWMSSKNNLFVGAQGTGSFNVVTGASPTWGTRLSINSTGNMGVGTTSPTERLHISGNIRFSGALMPNNAAGTTGQVLTSAGAGAPPTWTTPTTSQNIYNTDGTLTGARTITMGSNALNFRSNSASALAYLSYGRTAVEMDMGVAGAADNGFNGTVAGDSWLAGTSNLYVGTRGTGSFRVVTGAAGSGVTRIFVASGGAVGVGTSSPTERLDVAGNLRFTNALMPGGSAGSVGQVLTSAGAGAPPTWTNATTQNIYNIDGTLTSNRTINMAGRELSFLSNSESSYPIFNFGRIATEMDMGVASANGNGFAGTVPGDSWLGARKNLFVGAQTSTGSFNVVTGGATRIFVANGGAVGVGTSSPTERLDVAGNLRFTGSLMPGGSHGSAGQLLMSNGTNNAPSWTSLNAGNTPNIYTLDGTLTGNRTINMAGRELSFLSNSESSYPIFNFGRIATEMDMGVASANGNGLAGTVPGDSWLGARNNLFVGPQGSAGSFNVVTGGGATAPTRMTINSAGRVGIGLTNPLVKLHVADGNFAVTRGTNQTSSIGNGDATSSGFVVLENGTTNIENNDASAMLRFARRTGASPATNFTLDAFVEFRGANAAGTVTFLGAIYPNGTRNGLTYATSSDMRLKENIVPTHLGLAAVNDIKVYDYNFKTDTDKTPQTGFLAQELYKIFPQAVSVGGDDPKVKPWAVDYGKLTPILVKAIQEQQVQIEALKKEIENLKNK